MNCKSGDIARIVHPSEYGKLVLVRQLITSHEHRYPDGWLALGELGIWEVEMLGGPIQCWRRIEGRSVMQPVQFGGCDDKWLRPIRDTDGEDEMLRIVGKPQEAKRVTARAVEFARR